MHRRDFLRVGSLSAVGLSLPALLAAEARAAGGALADADGYAEQRQAAKARSCILLFLAGGPSHYETFDPKPDAPAEVRCLFDVISTSVPGTEVCGRLPRLARLAHRYTLIRSAHHENDGHFDGHRYVLTGHEGRGPARPSDRPGIASVAAQAFYGENTLPPSFMMPWVATDQGDGASGGMAAGTLGRQFDPVYIDVDRNTLGEGQVPAFHVPAFSLQPEITTERFDRRRDLLSLIDTQRRRMSESAGGSGVPPVSGTGVPPVVADMNTFYGMAYDLLTSPGIREAFEIEREPAELRERYGLDAFGQSCLLSRRLIERGARFAQVNFARYVTQDGYGWDTHNNGRSTLGDHLLPKLDAGLSALLEDLDGRGLLDETLVIAMGEFGRTPQLKQDGGRDHWPQCYSLLMAGGGIHGGLVYGRSDERGAYPHSHPVEPREVLLTILALLGIPTDAVDPEGRRAPLFPGFAPIDRLHA